MSLPVNPVLKELPTYPFAYLDTRRRELQAGGVDMIDLSIGDPGEAPPEFLAAAVAEAVSKPSNYPRAVGSDSLRRAIALWCARRFGVELDPAAHIIPCNGAKEAIFTLPLAICDSGKSVVMGPDPGYPVYKQGADFAGAEYVRLPLRQENGFLPDLDAVSEDTWDRAALLWINYPNNPTAAVAGLSWLRRTADLCRKHNVLLGSDEAYTEIYFSTQPPHTALEAGLKNVVAVHTLSKRSALPGFRSGFMAGDPDLIASLSRFRPGIGNATPGFIQHAAALAWGDEDHVTRLREEFKARRQTAAAGLARLGFSVTPSDATIYVWAAFPGPGDSESFVERCLEAGVVLLPGSAMGACGEGYIRLSLTRPVPDLEDAVTRIARVVQD